MFSAAGADLVKGIKVDLAAGPLRFPEATDQATYLQALRAACRAKGPTYTRVLAMARLLLMARPLELVGGQPWEAEQLARAACGYALRLGPLGVDRPTHSLEALLSLAVPGSAWYVRPFYGLTVPARPQQPYRVRVGTAEWQITLSSGEQRQMTPQAFADLFGRAYAFAVTPLTLHHAQEAVFQAVQRRPEAPARAS